MTKWTSRNIGSTAPAEIDPSLLEELVVILLQGKNTFGNPIYSYLQLQLKNVQGLKAKMLAGENFTPSDYGTVLAAGAGQPSDELRAEMTARYNLKDTPQPKKPSIPIPSIQPKLWGDEDEDGGDADLSLHIDPTPSVR